MIIFNEKGLQFEIELSEDDVKALEAYIAAVRIDERVRLINFLQSTIALPTKTEETHEVSEEPATEEPTAE